MELDRFWALISESRREFDPDRENGNMDAQVAAIRKLLSDLPMEDVAAFSNAFSKLFHDAYNWDLWAAGYIIEGGCGDDGFTDFRYWLISMGRDVYENAMTDAESLADVAFRSGIECAQFEEFGYIADETGNQLDTTAYDAELMEFKHPEAPSGKEWEDEDLPTRFPKLTAAEAEHGA